MLTDKGDFVLDPFGGSCVTGEVAERLQRRWICCDSVEEYVKGARGRFERSSERIANTRGAKAETYNVPNPLANPIEDVMRLASDGGQTRALTKKNGTHAHTAKVRDAIARQDEGTSKSSEQLRFLEEPVRYRAKGK